MRRFICLAGAGAAALLFASLWFDEGEVVSLITTDARGNRYETSLWIVDLEGVAFLRAESPSPLWLSRIQQIPEVKLDRGGRHTDYRAIPIEDEKVRDAVNRAMADKYGVFDQASRWIRDHSVSTSIQLQIVSASYLAPEGDHRLGVSP